MVCGCSGARGWRKLMIILSEHEFNNRQSEVAVKRNARIICVGC
ncbi:hypothetical protein AB395_00002963 [Sinorhizobium fredii CCBAU 45436]|nr:hypothetical protein AB395_00002963 [Sinorhizobium fredii CCBAU 45436]